MNHIAIQRAALRCLTFTPSASAALATTASRCFSSFSPKAPHTVRLVEEFSRQYVASGFQHASVLEPVSGFRYTVMGESHVDEAAHIVAATFSDPNRGEPMSVRRGVTGDDWYEFCRSCVSMGVDERLSIAITAENDNNALVATLVSFDFRSPVPELEPSLEDKLGPILDMVDKLDVHVPDKPAGSLLHQFLAAGLRSIAGHNVLSTAVLLNNEQARCRGYTAAVAEPTGPISQHLLHRLGYNRVFGLDYDTYEYKGHIPFKNLYETFQEKTDKQFIDNHDHQLTEFQLVMKTLEPLTAH